MFKKFFAKFKPVCPHDESRPYEYLEFKNWNRDVTMEVPRTCLEFLKIHDYMDAVGHDLGDKTRYISSEEKERILAHSHTLQIHSAVNR